MAGASGPARANLDNNFGVTVAKLRLLCYGQLLVVTCGFFINLGALAIEEGEIQLKLATSSVDLMLEDVRLKGQIGWSDTGHVEDRRLGSEP